MVATRMADLSELPEAARLEPFTSLHYSLPEPPNFSQFRDAAEPCQAMAAMSGLSSSPGRLATSSLSWAIGDMTLMRVAGPANDVMRAVQQAGRGEGGYLSIGLLRGGTLWQRAGKAALELRPGDLFHVTTSDSLEENTASCDLLGLSIPHEAMRGLMPASEWSRDRLIRTPLSALFRDYMESVERCLPRARDEDIPALRDVTISMVVACLCNTTASVTGSVEDEDDPRTQRIIQTIQDNLKLPTLGPKKICQMIGVSRSHLYRLFEGRGGLSHYIQDLRLVEVYSLLSKQDECRPISAIAREFGFADSSSFGRVFRARFGCCPSAVRAAARRRHIGRQTLR